MSFPGGCNAFGDAAMTAEDMPPASPADALTQWSVVRYCLAFTFVVGGGLVALLWAGFLAWFAFHLLVAAL